MQFNIIKQFAPCSVNIDKNYTKAGATYFYESDVIVISGRLNKTYRRLALIHEIKHAKDKHRNIFKNPSESEYRAFISMVKYTLHYGNNQERTCLIKWLQEIHQSGVDYYVVAMRKVITTKCYQRLINNA